MIRIGCFFIVMFTLVACGSNTPTVVSTSYASTPQPLPTVPVSTLCDDTSDFTYSVNKIKTFKSRGYLVYQDSEERFYSLDTESQITYSIPALEKQQTNSNIIVKDLFDICYKHILALYEQTVQGKKWLFSGGYNAEFSPTEDKIAFIYARIASCAVFIMNADGTDPHPVTEVLSPPIRFAWSPDGKWLAVGNSKADDKKNTIRIVSVDGKQTYETDIDGLLIAWTD